jgi:HAD superfamily hydrolase (TIGR01490 family)
MAAEGNSAAPAAAFFDLDRTLMQGSSAFQFGRAAYKAGLLSRRQLIADGWANIKFRLYGASDENTHALRDRISSSLRGVRVLDMERLGAPVLARVLPRIYPEVLDIAHEHQDAGRQVFITTAASQELADILARVLSFDGGIGSQFSAIENGVYTGQPTGLFIYGPDKAKAIERLAAERGFELSDCYAYSDSASDLPMLELVGHAVAVNPDRQLLRTARERGWGVLRFDRLGRRLKAGVALAGAAAAGGIGSAAVASKGKRGLRAVVRVPGKGRGGRLLR